LETGSLATYQHAPYPNMDLVKECEERKKWKKKKGPRSLFLVSKNEKNKSFIFQRIVDMPLKLFVVSQSIKIVYHTFNTHWQVY
jgi:hypothetical protein